MLKDGQKAPSLNSWVQQFKDTLNRPEVLIENAAVGTLSSDGKRVYLVDDLQVPPSTPRRPTAGAISASTSGSGPAWTPTSFRPSTSSAASCSGSWAGRKPATTIKTKHDFRDSYFLGAPSPWTASSTSSTRRTGRFAWSASTPASCRPGIRRPRISTRPSPGCSRSAPPGKKIIADYGRRINGASPRLRRGRAGVSDQCRRRCRRGRCSLTISCGRTRTARSRPRSRSAAAGQHGAGPGPRVEGVSPHRAVRQGGVRPARRPRAALPRPSRRVPAVDHKRRDDDVYLGGVIAGRVLVVGKKDVRALALADGKEAWKVPTGMPTGRGAASDNVYYLPLKETAGKTGPEVVAIDVAKGRAIAHTHARRAAHRHRQVPGNITFSDGLMISQSATELVAYPLLKTKLAHGGRRLKKNPKDPRGLFERGELRQEEGNPLGDVKDYRAALANDPPAELRPEAARPPVRRLDRAASAGFRRRREVPQGVRGSDPRSGRSGGARGRAGRMGGGRRARRADLLFIKGRGYEGQGKAVDALNGLPGVGRALKEPGC